MSRTFRTDHPDVRSGEEIRVASKPPQPHYVRDTTWRARFRDENGQPLPPDPIRVDVTTGEIVDDSPPPDFVPW